MSTGADNRTMPVTTAYEEGHTRIFGERNDLAPTRRRHFVSRCSSCDGVTHEPGTRLWPCERCNNETRGLVDINAAPPVQSADAKAAPIMVDRFMEGSVATDGTDIGSRRKREEYKRREGVTDKSDYGPGWADRKREEKARVASEGTKRTVTEIVKLDQRHLPRFLEEKKK
jgi:ribosomal protein L37AE/L43A